MLSDEQLKEEAHKRLVNLSPEKRAEYEKEINEFYDLLDSISGAMNKETEKNFMI